jgi:hypothetical protein
MIYVEITPPAGPVPSPGEFFNRLLNVESCWLGKRRGWATTFRDLCKRPINQWDRLPACPVCLEKLQHDRQRCLSHYVLQRSTFRVVGLFSVFPGRPPGGHYLRRAITGWMTQSFQRSLQKERGRPARQLQRCKHQGNTRASRPRSGLRAPFAEVSFRIVRAGRGAGRTGHWGGDFDWGGGAPPPFQKKMKIVLAIF